MKPFAIAGLQLALETRDNLERVLDKTRVALERFPWIEMVVLNELGVCGPSVDAAEALPSDAETRLADLSRDLGIWLVTGSLFEKVGNEIFNTTSVINPAGEVVCRYRKMYPFYPYEKGVTQGRDIVTFDVPDVGRFGISICYDMWFPEHSRALVMDGAEIILHPTMTNTQDREIERAIVRATAAQNQTYVIDVNSCGAQAYGKSIIVGPEGEIIHEAGEIEEIMLVEVDLDRVRRTRERGLMGLGQPLKSYRDAGHTYSNAANDTSSEFLDSLGPLIMPERGRH